MGVVVKENTAESPVPPAKLYKAMLLDSHITMPKVIPQFIKSVEFLEGDGGPGSIRKTNFADESGYKYVKAKIEVVDKDNFAYTYTAFEGEPWIEGLDKATYESKMEASPSGGSIVKATSKYYPKEGATLDSDKVKSIEDNAFSMFKAVEAHILANPTA